MKGAWGLGLLVVLAACGGHASRAGDRDPANQGGGGAVAGEGSAGRGFAGAASAPLGCPDPSLPACSFRFLMELHFDGTTTKSADGRVWAEPLQLPSVAEYPLDHQPTPVEPADWDRSRLPAGACVFKLHGARARCLAGASGRVSGGSCDQPGRPVLPPSYYEFPYCAEGLAPGCPSDDRFVGGNSVWYTVPEEDGEDATLLVLCAGICGFFAPSAQATMCVRGGPVP